MVFNEKTMYKDMLQEKKEKKGILKVLECIMHYCEVYKFNSLNNEYDNVNLLIIKSIMLGTFSFLPCW